MARHLPQGAFRSNGMQNETGFPVGRAPQEEVLRRYEHRLETPFPGEWLQRSCRELAGNAHRSHLEAAFPTPVAGGPQTLRRQPGCGIVRPRRWRSPGASTRPATPLDVTLLCRQMESGRMCFQRAHLFPTARNALRAAWFLPRKGWKSCDWKFLALQSFVRPCRRVVCGNGPPVNVETCRPRLRMLATLSARGERRARGGCELLLLPGEWPLPKLP